MSYKWKYIAFCVWHNVLLTKITLQQNKLDTPWVGRDFTLQGYSEQDGKQYLYVLFFGVVLSHVLTPGRAIIFLVRLSLSQFFVLKSLLLSRSHQNHLNIQHNDPLLEGIYSGPTQEL